MTDDDTKRPDQLAVPESGKSIDMRKPFEVDGVTCSCGGHSFFVGIAESHKACSYCHSLLVTNCLDCFTWTCLGCVEKSADAERKKLGVTVLYPPTTARLS